MRRCLAGNNHADVFNGLPKMRAASGRRNAYWYRGNRSGGKRIFTHRAERHKCRHVPAWFGGTRCPSRRRWQAGEVFLRGEDAADVGGVAAGQRDAGFQFVKDVLVDEDGLVIFFRRRGRCGGRWL